MVFGKIDYLNLLPFYVFLKKNLKSSSEKTALALKKGTPAQINEMFEKNKIDCAVISSIKSFGYKCTNLGIVAQDEVLSVLVVLGDDKKDSESKTSNALASTLDIKGQVIIGDKALKAYLGGVNAVDLAKEWKKRHKLPFVFARLCFHSHGDRLKNLSKKFLKTDTKIPYYIMKKYSQKTGIEIKNIEKYLQKISYKIGKKEELSLKRFKKECLLKGLL